MPFFQGDFFDNIVNVSWGGGLWLAAISVVTTGNNVAPPSGSSPIEVGGTPADMFSGSTTNPLTITSEMLKDDQISIYKEFITGDTGDPFVDSIQGFRLFNLDNLLSVLGPGVPIAGELSVTVDGAIPGDGSVIVGLLETKILRRRTIELLRSREYTAGMPVPLLSGTRKSEIVFGAGTATLTFQIDVEAKTLV